MGIPRNATRDEIKRAYRKLAHQYHPDKKSGDEKRFKEINEAYQVLEDENKRRQYDQFGSSFQGRDFSGFSSGSGSAGASPFGNADFGDIFEDIFAGFGGDFYGGHGKRRQKRGRDISIGIDIAFSDSVFGIRRSIVLEKTSTCEHCGGEGGEPGSKANKCAHCQGTGTIRESRRSVFGTFTSLAECSNCGGRGEIPEKVCQVCRGVGVLRKQENIDIEIPPGIRDGEAIKLSGMGEAAPGAVSGDLYVKIRVMPHPIFRREGQDILTDLNVSPSKMLLGGKEILETLEGKIEVRIPELSKAGDFLRIRGKGVPKLRGGRGDLLIRIFPRLPKKLSSRARDLLSELEKEGL